LIRRAQIFDWLDADYIGRADNLLTNYRFSGKKIHPKSEATHCDYKPGGSRRRRTNGKNQCRIAGGGHEFIFILRKVTERPAHFRISGLTRILLTRLAGILNLVQFAAWAVQNQT